MMKCSIIDLIKRYNHLSSDLQIFSIVDPVSNTIGTILNCFKRSEIGKKNNIAIAVNIYTSYAEVLLFKLFVKLTKPKDNVFI